ncbi:hypothetical protein GCM10017600_33310 [Streptosporangium carneum]|uniref:Uncharacterized protein n=2 Tax=Streptosporangium carneum TaxID=47481 RepID=A0A9W6MDH5_9ACTN|nr:hypothetical protein GCM10017600_33310 [Streptosporangium carneum]
MLVAGATVLPVPAGAVAEDPVIRSVTLSPDAPVVGPVGAVRLVIEVVAAGVTGPDGVTVQVEPGVPPKGGAKPAPAPAPLPAPVPLPDPGTAPVPVPAPVPAPAPVPGVGPGPAAGEPRGAEETAPASVSWTGGPLSPGAPGRRATGVPAQEVARRAGREWETWRFLPDKELTRWYPAGRWTVTVRARGADGAVATERTAFWLRRETRFSAVQAVGRGSGVRVSGVLNRVDPQGYLDYAPFPGRPLDIMYRRARGDAWENVASATTDERGHFARNVPDTGEGEWRIRFGGTGRYAARRSIIHPTTL